MRREGVKKVRMALGNYVKHLKTGKGSKTSFCLILYIYLYIINHILVTCFHRVLSGYDFTNRKCT